MIDIYSIYMCVALFGSYIAHQTIESVSLSYVVHWLFLLRFLKAVLSYPTSWIWWHSWYLLYSDLNLSDANWSSPEIQVGVIHLRHATFLGREGVLDWRADGDVSLEFQKWILRQWGTEFSRSYIPYNWDFLPKRYPGNLVPYLVFFSRQNSENLEKVLYLELYAKDKYNHMFTLCI